MNIFYTKATTWIFEGSTQDVSVRDRLSSFLKLEDAKAMSLHEQVELYLTEMEGDYKIYWIGIRMNKPGRVIGAMVRDATGARSFFALEVTPVHDYLKTLVGNPKRLASWRQALLSYLSSEQALESNTSYQEEVLQRLVHHEGRLRVPDVQQVELIDIPLREGVLCFGPPGAGKTLVGIQRALDYVRNELKTVMLTPKVMLSEGMRAEFLRQEIDASPTGSQFWSYEAYLAAMAHHYPELHLVYDRVHDARQYVDFSYFRTWYGRGKRTKLTDAELMALWQEFNYVLLQPHWQEPASSVLSLTAYMALGIGQSNIPMDDRSGFYETVFHPFFTQINNPALYYFPPLIAQQLYNALLRTPLTGGDKFDALLLDEVQKFHPWEWACILTLLKEPLAVGQFFICGDAYQGAECQPLRVAESLRGYFEAQRVRLPIYHLKANHRNSQTVSRLVAELHALELTMLGSMERDTHVKTEVNQEAAVGQVSTHRYSPSFRTRIARDASAYVLIPEESCRVEAQQLWPSHQVVSLSEFAGMSAQTVVMHGFSTYFRQTLDRIEANFPTDEDLPLSDAQPSYARKFKGLGLALPVLRAGFQSLYTAASRAEVNLIIIESAGLPHPLLQRLCARHKPEAAAAAVVVSEPVMTEMVSTPEDWFKRAEEDFNKGLEAQARLILLREDLWGTTKTAALRRLMETSRTHGLFVAARAILFPPASAITEPSVPRAAVEDKAKSKASKPKAERLSFVEEALDPKLCALLETLSNSKNAADFKKLLKVEEHQLIQSLFVHKLKKGYCLAITVVSVSDVKFFHEMMKSRLIEIRKGFIALKTSDILLQLCWEEICLVNQPKTFRESVKQMMANASQWRELLSTNFGILFVNRHWDMLIAEKILTAKIMNEPSSLGESALAVLLRNLSGVMLFCKKWDSFKRNKLIFPESMHRVTAADYYQGTTPFFSLARTPIGLQLITDHWDDFVALKLLSPDSMHQMMIAEGEGQGTTPFFMLVGTATGCQLIIDHWDDFVALKLISPDSMNNVVTGEGEYQGTTAFYWLVGSGAYQLLNDRWEYFVKHSLITAASMHRVVTGEGKEKGATAFFWLAGCAEGCRLINERWDDFVSHGLLSPNSMHETITADVVNQGTTPFFWLTAQAEGRQVIIDHWDYFVRHGLLSPLSMHKVVTREGPNQGVTAFCCLAGAPEGRQLMIDRWDDFVDQGLFSAISMHQVVNKDGEIQGLTAFYLFVSTPEGLQLINEHWDYFVTQGLLSPISMHQVVTGGIVVQETTPFYELVRKPIGRQLISDHWDDFVALGLFPSQQSMNVTITIEGQDDDGYYLGQSTIFEELNHLAQGRGFSVSVEPSQTVTNCLQNHGLFASDKLTSSSKNSGKALLMQSLAPTG